MSDNLSSKKCIPCSGGVPAMFNAEAEKFIKNTPDWKIIQGDNEYAPKGIYREFKFKNFVQALDFVNKIGEIAEAEMHHPDIKFGWGYVNILVQTHKINGLHENDFILAAKIDQAVPI